MSRKKNNIILIISIITVIILMLLIRYINKIQVFTNLVNDTTKNIVKILNHDTITGEVKFNIKVDAYNGDRKILNPTDYYLTDYQINLKQGYIKAAGKFNYDKDKYTNKIYLKNNEIYILTDNVYDKYVGLEVNYLDFLNDKGEYKNVINIFRKEFTNILKKKHYLYKEDEYEGKKVNKIILNITNNKNLDVRKDLIKKLLNNKKFIKSLATYKKINKKEAKTYLKKMLSKNYKFTLYTQKNNNKFIKLNVVFDEKELVIKLDDEKYYFEYYLRDGIIYKGDIDFSNNKITKISFLDVLKNYKITVKIEKIKIIYDKNIKNVDIINLKNSIKYKQLTNKDKEKMKSNLMIKELYDNYQNRNKVKGEEVPTKEEETLPDSFPETGLYTPINE